MNTIKKEIITKGILSAITNPINQNKYIWDNDGIKWHIYNYQLFKSTANSIQMLDLNYLPHEELFYLSTWTSKLNELSKSLQILIDTLKLFIRAEKLILNKAPKYKLLRAQTLNRSHIQTAFYRQLHWNDIGKQKLETIPEYLERLKPVLHKQLEKHCMENTLLMALKIYNEYTSFYHELEETGQ